MWARVVGAQEMQKVLTEQLSWAHECNGKLKKTYAFVLASANLKALPLADVDVASRLRFDFRGDAQSIAMREVSTLMRDPSTKLPFWRSATAYDGVPNLLRALEGWLGADARTADAGKPRAQLRTACLLTAALSHVISLTQSHRGHRLGDQRGAWVCADAARPRLGAGRWRAAQALGCRCPAPAVRPVQRAGGRRQWSAGCLGGCVGVPVWPQADGGGQEGALPGPAAQAVWESGPRSDADRRQGQGEEHAGGGRIQEEEASGHDIQRVRMDCHCVVFCARASPTSSLAQLTVEVTMRLHSAVCAT